MSTPPVTESDLHAYLDGHLPAERHSEVLSYRSKSPDVAARMQAYRSQIDAMRTAFDPVLDEPVPPQLARRPASHGLSRTNIGAWRGIAASIAIALVCATSAMGGWMLRGIQQQPIDTATLATSRMTTLNGAALPREAADRLTSSTGSTESLVTRYPQASTRANWRAWRPLSTSRSMYIKERGAAS
ncbi:anti-sigma factor family protein [Burkholderia pyrrocinia]|uniref:anti-sigma factor family protein n=1 Tax=Burkholderia pyrrocinia TaxID=60550 RepID=UPI001F3E76C7|nr:hypothetical protein [Burkholderia pyrrocinia]